MIATARLSVVILAVAGLLVSGPARADNASPRRTALVSRVVLKVVHPVLARQHLLEAARERGGFVTLLSDQQLVLKVPPERLDEVLTIVAAEGAVVEKTLERADLTERIAQLEGRLRSKVDILTRLRAFVDDSNVQATLQLERSMTALVSEVEQVKGELRVERERARWAVVDIAFQFRERGRIVYVRSPFVWLNTVDLGRFLSEF